MTSPYYSYWAKTDRGQESGGPSYHLLPYDCLDVAAVADIWLQKSKFLRLFFPWQCQLPEEECRAWLLFFVSLHDLGKVDLRFQMKSPETVQLLQTDLLASFPSILKPALKKYDHGSAGYAWFGSEAMEYGCNYISMEAAEDWMRCVAGHHGSLPTSSIGDAPPLIDPQFVARDGQARRELVMGMAEIFLQPQALSLADVPEVVPDFLAGFCSICDWLGSNSDYFPLLAREQELQEYYPSRLHIAEEALAKSGMLSSLQSQGGMQSLYPAYQPRDVQALVDDFDIGQGLTIIEAQTGSGKAEAAIAYAVKLMDRGLADSMTFALPSMFPTGVGMNRYWRRVGDTAEKKQYFIRRYSFQKGIENVDTESTP